MGWAIVAVNPQSCTQHVEHELQGALNGGHPIHPKNSPFKTREVLDCEAIEYLVLQVHARNYLAGEPEPVTYVQHIHAFVARREAKINVHDIGQAVVIHFYFFGQSTRLLRIVSCAWSSVIP